MALTFVQKMYGSDGNKRHVIYEVTHDDGTATVNASDIGLNYIDYAIVTPVSLSTGATGGDTFFMLSDGGPGKTVTFANALSAPETCALEAWGW